MRIREFFVETIGYKLFPCWYNRFHNPLFAFVRSKIPSDFIGRSIYDLGCGDGENTVRIQRIFQPKEIIACDRSLPMLERARGKGLKVLQIDFNKELPKGEMATFTYSLHHAYDREKVLTETINNFSYVFICEPFSTIFSVVNWGHAPTKKQWIEIFDVTLGQYELYEYKDNLVAFFKR